MSRTGASTRDRLPRAVALAVVGVAVAVFVVQLIRYQPYSAGSPKIRVTVAGGCPHSLGKAVDVNSPGPSWWHELWHRSRLAPTGATSGLVCGYAGDVLQERVSMSPRQASAISAAANNVSTKHRSASPHCPADLGDVAIVVLGYPGRAETDIWWHVGGCQTADNGHVEAFQVASDSFAKFQDAVEAVAPLNPMAPPGR